MFPDNEFFQCPSYTYSSFVLATVVALIIFLVSKINMKAVPIATAIGSLFLVFWALRTVYLWVSPNKECAATGYPGMRYGNPFWFKE
jgi:hypothetical protein